MLSIMSEVYISVDKLYNFMKDVFMGLGYPEEEAKISAAVLIESDLRGIHSHGVQRLHYYYVRVKSGQHLVNKYEIIKDELATAVIDGNHGNGHYISYKAMRMAIEKAKIYGIGMVVVRNSTHYGIAGYYPLMAIKEGCLGITGTNARPAVAPTFGGEPMYGTNPITFGFPTDEEFPFVLDCATSIIQRGKVEIAARDGTPLPEGTVIDRETGKIRTDAEQLLKDFVDYKAALLPLGGAGEDLSGYKGYGYATVVEILSAALQDGAFLKNLSGFDEEGNKAHFCVGHFFIAIDPEHFLGLETFKSVAGSICRGLRNSDKIPDAIRIYTAGEKEYEAEIAVQENGVPVSKSIQKDILLMKEELGLTQHQFDFE